MVFRFAVAACALTLGLSGTADTIWDYQEVRASDGLGIHPLVDADPDPQNRVTIEGVALAGVDEILNPAVMYTIFVQDDTQPLGGIQVWAGSWWYGGLWRPAEYVDFQAGDRVRVTGLLANHNGKVFINDRHSPAPQTRFVVEVIGHAGMPDPWLIPSIGSCNYFDATRVGGGERYQTRWVMLHGVEITAGTWGNDQLLTITDNTGSVGMLLAGPGDFSSYPQPSGKLNVVGIFDQEDTSLPYFDDYRVWVKRRADIAAALDWCNQVQQVGAGEQVALVGKLVVQSGPNEFIIEDASGEVVVVSDHPVAVGDVVAVQGSVTREGIEARYVTVLPVNDVVLTATIALESYAPGPAGVPVQIWVYDVTSGGDLVGSYQVVLDGNGQFIQDLGIKQSTGREYRVRAKASHWLAADFSFTAGGDQVVTWELVNGDADGDNQIGLGDLNRMLLSFARNDDPEADVDGDGTVALGDLNVALINFARAGAP